MEQAPSILVDLSSSLASGLSDAVAFWEARAAESTLASELYEKTVARLVAFVGLLKR